MSSGVGVVSTEGRCFPFWRKIMECRDNSLYPRKECAPFVEDYMECLHHKKEVVPLLQ